MSSLVTVTGASGFLGKRLVALLLAEGYNVRAIHRRESPPAELIELACDSLEIMRADLSDPAESLGAVRNSDVIIHAAALARDWGTSSEFMKANVEVTEILVDAARNSGCRQFIFVSSLSVHGFGYHQASTEEGPYYPISNPYPVSKKIAESEVFARNNADFSVSVLRLGYIFGPGDTTSTYRMFDAASRGVFGWIGKGSNRTGMVYIDDACQALAKAIDNPSVKGEIANVVGDESICWRDFAFLIYKVLGLDKKPVRLPKAFAFLAAALLTAFSLVIGNREGPPLTFYRVKRSTVGYEFSNSKAKRLLGFTPSFGIEEGLTIAVAAYRKKESVSFT